MPPPAIPPETAEEITGPIPVVADEAEELDEVVPQAPLDVRLAEGLGSLLGSRPRWSTPPPSMAEAWEYSTTGDWTTSEKSAGRVLHGLAVLAAFAVTYPIDWAVQAARSKPIGFVLLLAVLFVLSKVL